MKSFFTKKTVFFIVAILTVMLIVFLKLNKKTEVPVVTPPVAKEVPTVKKEVIGKSVEGREIENYTFGNGPKHLVFVGGIHGGYEWNSVMLAYKLIDFLKENPNELNANLTVSVIPSANPDGLFKVVDREGRFGVSDVSDNVPLGTGRFNANGVDLNRNFDCKWAPEATWRSKKVSAGTQPFSEPESVAIRDFTLKEKPNAFVFFHSQANAVYASECKNGVLPVTLDIMNVYAKSAGYPAIKSFDSYVVTGDVEGWLASINIPAISVELKTHETIEWEKNLAGIKALFKYYSL